MWIALVAHERRPAAAAAAAAAGPAEAEADDDDEDERQNELFGRHFRLGARLEVARPRHATGVAVRWTARGTARAKAAAKEPPRSAAPKFRCPRCGQTFGSWLLCLQHLRDSRHAPERESHEDTATCARRWMAMCTIDAKDLETERSKGECEAPMAESAEPEARQSAMLLVGLAHGQHCPAVADGLVADAAQCGDRHGCTVWALPWGLSAHCPRSEAADGRLARAVEELECIVRFYLPDFRRGSAAVGGALARPAAEAAGARPAAWQEGTVDDIIAWFERMQHQQEEDSDGENGGEGAAGTGTPLSAAAPPFVPEGVACCVAGLRVLVLCGLPGSGKSTLAARLSSEFGWGAVNQDELGSRQACMKAARQVLRRPGGRLVVDRCNVDPAQRSVWVQLALQEFGLGALHLGCAWLDVPEEECDQRVLQRFGHRTLLPEAASLRVIRGFAAGLRPPSAGEGFARLWRLASDADHELFWAELSAAEGGERPSDHAPAEAAGVASGTPLAAAGAAGDSLDEPAAAPSSASVPLPALRLGGAGGRGREPSPPRQGAVLPSGAPASAAEPPTDLGAPPPPRRWLDGRGG
ncbi:unnamed protein product, partial [Prorocentrum cordatum]